MSYVEPNGRIQLFKGINLDNRYMHTIYFNSEAAQDAWFNGKATAALSFTKQYYTRQNNGVIRVKATSDLLAECTYLRFQNKDSNNIPSVPNNHSTKWYYAFITSINYVNENVTEITFEIDVIQTWYIPTITAQKVNGGIRPCLIERNHVSDDSFGKHLEAEPVGSDLYDMVELTATDSDPNAPSEYDTLAKCFDRQHYSVVIQTSSNPIDTPLGTGDYSDMVKGGIFNGIWEYTQPLWAHEGTPSGSLVLNTQQIYDDMMEFLGSFNQYEQLTNVLNIIQFPSRYLSNRDCEYMIKFPLNNNQGRAEFLDGYIPQNKKLYGYPYNYLFLTTMDGDNSQYRWEYFTTNESGSSDLGTVVQFALSANECGAGVISMYPDAYNGVLNHFDAKVTASNFPKCPFSYDAYQAWVASGGKNKIEFQTQMAEQRGAYAIEQIGINQTVAIGNAVTGIANSSVRAASSPTTAGMISGIASGVNAGIGGIGAFASGEISKQLVGLDVEEAQKKMEFTFKDARYQPNQVVGGQAPNVAVGTGQLCFRFFNVHVRKEELTKLDDFFTVYGYAYNKVDNPSITNGRYWTFLKTNGCVVSGDMPSSSKEALERIFDGGIFFWKNGDNVGNFEVGGRNTYGALINK